MFPPCRARRASGYREGGGFPDAVPPRQRGLVVGRADEPSTPTATRTRFLAPTGSGRVSCL
ncbi:predicted protein [Streptomyces sp. SPB78]|nr:predicted protein [Streptomyces sp. SPB78]